MLSSKPSVILLAFATRLLLTQIDNYVGITSREDARLKLLAECLPTPAFVQGLNSSEVKYLVELERQLEEWKPSTVIFLIASGSSVSHNIEFYVSLKDGVELGAAFSSNPRDIYFSNFNSTGENENVVVFELNTYEERQIFDTLKLSLLLSYTDQAKFVIELNPEDATYLGDIDRKVHRIARLLTNVPVTNSLHIFLWDARYISAKVETYVTEFVSALANATNGSAITSETDLLENKTHVMSANWNVAPVILNLATVTVKDPLEIWFKANCSWDEIQTQIFQTFENELLSYVNVTVPLVLNELEKKVFHEIDLDMEFGGEYLNLRLNEVLMPIENFTRESSSKSIFEAIRILGYVFVGVSFYVKEDEVYIRTQELRNATKYLERHIPTIQLDSTLVNSYDEFVNGWQNTTIIISFFTGLCTAENKIKMKDLVAPNVTLSSVFNLLAAQGIATVEPELLHLFEKQPKFIGSLVKLVQYHSTRGTKITCEKIEHKTNTDLQTWRLVVAGKYVAFSDFFSSVKFSSNSFSKWGGQCDGYNIKEVLVLASEAVYLDKGLDATGLELSITIIAPNLHVVGLKRSITLNGKHKPALESNPGFFGSWFTNKPGRTFEKAENGQSEGANGANGKNGETGQDGGHFLAIFNKMTNWQGLSVKSVGGNGGNGQEGGDGRDGKQGRHVTPKDFPIWFSSATRISKLSDGSSGVLYKGDIDGDKMIASEHSAFMLGWPGSSPGNGGKGGDAGLPGRSGTLTLVNVGTDLANPNLYMKLGEYGRPGVGGTEGRNIPGRHMVCGSVGALTGLNCDFRVTCETTWFCDPNKASRSRANGGSVPTKLTMTSVPSKTNTARVIVNYKNIFFQERLAKHKFLLDLDMHPKLLTYTSPLSIAEDLTNLEERYYAIGYKKDVEFEHLFALLSARIIEYVNYSANLTASGLSPSNKYSLSYIYAAALSKLSALRDDQRNGTVINTAHFFDNLRTQLGYLKEAKQAEIVEAQCAQFEATLNAKVDETMGFIRNTVMPAVNQVEEGMNNSTQQMVREMNDKLQTSQDNLKKAEDAKKEFENMSIWRVLFSVVKVVASFASFLGPVGQTVGGLVTTTAGVAESLALGPVETPALNIPDDFEKALATNLQPMMEDRAKTIGAFVQDTRLLLDTKTTELSTVISKVDQLEANQKALIAAVSDSSVTAVDVMEIEMKMNGKVKELENEIEVERKKVDDAMKGVEGTKSDLDKAEKKANDKTLGKVLGKVGAGIQVAKSSFQVYQTFIANADTSEKLQENINRARKNVELIENKKVAMYNTFMPMFKSIAPSLKKGAQSLSGVSQGGLMVKKWQVKSGLQSIRREVEGFTKGMDIGEEMKLCVEKLMEAMTLLIDLYDHIEAYEEKKQMANYIANVNSPSARNVYIQDSELRQIITKLEAATKANFLLGEYHRGLHAFKKWAFPFGKRYLDSDRQLTDMSALLGTNQNLNQAADIYMQKVLILSDQLQRYNASTSSEHEMIRVSHFKTGLNGVVPFFYWRQEDWKESIGQLFAGNTVQLPASLMYSSDMGITPGENGFTAVKYRDIELVVTARNTSQQPEVDLLLSHFRVSFTHSGISNYEFARRKYVIHDNSVTYEHSFEKVGNKMAFVTENMARHLQTQRGNCLMSPFTMWNVQLLDALPASGLSMSHLPSIATQVDLSLQGHGIFIDENRVSKTDLDALDTASYYESYDAKL